MPIILSIFTVHAVLLGRHRSKSVSLLALLSTEQWVSEGSGFFFGSRKNFKVIWTPKIKTQSTIDNRQINNSLFSLSPLIPFISIYHLISHEQVPVPYPTMIAPSSCASGRCAAACWGVETISYWFYGQMNIFSLLASIPGKSKNTTRTVTTSTELKSIKKSRKKTFLWFFFPFTRCWSLEKKTKTEGGRAQQDKWGRERTTNKL